MRGAAPSPIAGSQAASDDRLLVFVVGISWGGPGVRVPILKNTVDRVTYVRKGRNCQPATALPATRQGVRGTIGSATGMGAGSLKGTSGRSALRQQRSIHAADAAYLATPARRGAISWQTRPTGGAATRCWGVRIDGGLKMCSKRWYVRANQLGLETGRSRGCGDEDWTTTERAGGALRGAGYVDSLTAGTGWGRFGVQRAPRGEVPPRPAVQLSAGLFASYVEM